MIILTTTKLKRTGKKKKIAVCKGYGIKEGNCTNQTVDPDKNPYCRNCAGYSFENQIARLFNIQGYKITNNIKITSTQHDFFAELQYGIAKLGILIECKWKFDEDNSSF